MAKCFLNILHSTYISKVLFKKNVVFWLLHGKPYTADIIVFIICKGKKPTLMNTVSQVTNNIITTVKMNLHFMTP